MSAKLVRILICYSTRKRVSFGVFRDNFGIPERNPVSFLNIQRRSRSGADALSPLICLGLANFLPVLKIDLL
ncbi:hypothetical protein [Planktothricoides sp. SR001]|uniref:hypothetical protein n=1 Tax=Planktothricoides sp. SR001 TaxID=1705388 RepID=UPI0012E2B8E8|nr:hypothetical protein [Planktothricoides sp. SR001]